MRIAKFLAVVLLITLSVVAGLKIGVHVGQREFLLQEGSVKSALLVHELRALRGGHAEKLIEAKEVELDGEIVKALEFRDSGHPWLLWPLDGGYEHTRYLRSAAKYRTEYPAAVPELQFGEKTPMADEMNSYAQLVRDRTQELLRDYGK